MPHVHIYLWGMLPALQTFLYSKVTILSQFKMVHSAASRLQKLHKPTSTACPQAEAKKKKTFGLYASSQWQQSCTCQLLFAFIFFFFSIKTRQREEYQILKPQGI